MNKNEVITEALTCRQEDGSIDIIQLASKLGLDVYVTESSENIGEIVYLFEQNKFEILVSANLSLHQQRFCVAHELAHYVLHPEKIKEYGSLKKSSNYPDPISFSKLEQEADEFGGELLMPEELLRSLCPEVFKNSGQLSIALIREIASKLKVSALVFATRLRKLNLEIPYISYAYST